MKRILAAALVLGALTGCDTIAAGDTGTVVSKRERESRYGTPYYLITVDADHGPNDSARVSPEVYEACRLGDRWPSCKKGVD